MTVTAGENIQPDDRYSRQEAVQGWDQSSVRDGKVILVGVGALGCVVGTNLAQAGVGHLLLVDMDTIEFSNLNRQLLFRESDVGRMKAEVARERLLDLNSAITVEVWTKRVQELPLSSLQPASPGGRVVVVDGLDNFEGRRWVNSAIVHQNVPLVSAGMFAHLGNVQVVLPGKTPCLECQPLIPERELQKACTPVGDFRRGEGHGEEEEVVELEDVVEEYFPALGSVASVVGGIQSQEALKLLQSFPEDKLLTDYLFVDLEVGSFLRVPLGRREDCVVCSPKYKLGGVPFPFDPEEDVSVFRGRVALQFNLPEHDLELMARASSLPTTDALMGSVVSGESPKVYVIAPQLPSPVKLTLVSPS